LQAKHAFENQAQAEQPAPVFELQTVSQTVESEAYTDAKSEIIEVPSDEASFSSMPQEYAIKE